MHVRITAEQYANIIQEIYFHKDEVEFLTKKFKAIHGDAYEVKNFTLKDQLDLLLKSPLRRITKHLVYAGLLSLKPMNDFVFKDLTLDGTVFFSVPMEGVTFDNCYIKVAQLDNCFCPNLTIKNSVIETLLVANCDIHKALIEDARGGELVIQFSNLLGTSLNRLSDLIITPQFCFLDSTHVKNCKNVKVEATACSMKFNSFSDVTMQKSFFKDCNLLATRFDDTDLTSSQFERCYLLEASFRKTVVQGAEFEDCHFGDTSMKYSIGKPYFRDTSEVNLV